MMVDMLIILLVVIVSRVYQNISNYKIYANLLYINYTLIKLLKIE